MTMLDSMRRHRAWLKWSLALVVLTFIFFFIPTDFLSPQQATVGAAPREVIAEVGGRDLTAGDFQQRYTVRVAEFRQQFGGTLNAQILRQLGVEQQVLVQMIDEEVALIEAERQNITVSDEELRRQLLSIPGLQENGQFIGQARYEQILLQQLPPMTVPQFEEGLRRQLLIDKLRSAVTDWMAVSDAELDREYTRRNEKIKLQVVNVGADAFRDKVTVTDADAAAYYESKKAEYRVGEQRTIRYLLLDQDAQRQKVAVPPADIQRYYNENIQQFQTPEQIRASHILLNTGGGKDEAIVRKRAEEILAKARAGADFAALAKQYSEDEGSKAAGGDLDFFPRGRMVPEFEEAAWKMKPGEISDLVKSSFGFHIIKLADRRPGTSQSLDQVRPQIQAQLAADLASQQLVEQATRLEGRIKNVGDLDEAAGELGLSVQESGAFQRDDPVPGLGVSPQVAAAAFTLKDGEASGPLTTSRGIVFAAVAGKQNPYVPKLEEVATRVRTDLIASRASELSRRRAAEIGGALKTAGGDFAAAAKKQGFEAKDTELVPRGSALPDVGVQPDVERVVFGLAAGTVSDPIPTDTGTVIVRVVERDEVTPEELAKGREAFRAEFLGERRNRFFTAYMNKVKSRLAIEVKQDVLRRITAAQNQS